MGQRLVEPNIGRRWVEIKELFGVKTKYIEEPSPMLMARKPEEPSPYGSPKASTLALIDRIEKGTADMAGPFETFEEYKAWVTSDD